MTDNVTLRPKVLFIVGTGRIGSTIIEQILGQTDGFWPTGELYRIWQDGLIEGDFCGCGVPLPKCPFWRSVLVKAFGALNLVEPEKRTAVLDTYLRTRPLDLARLSYEASHSAASSPARKYGEILRRMYQAVAEVSGSRIIVDSTKLPAHALVALAFADVDLYILHLVRDPRAIAYSWSRNPDAAGRQGRSNLGFRGKGVVESTAQWDFFGLVADGVLRRRLGQRYLALRYEDFVARPRQRTEEIYAFLDEGTAKSPFLDERTVELTDNHIIGGNRARFRRGRVIIQPDEAWKIDMSRTSRLACVSIAWPLMLRYGYPLFRTTVSPSS